MTLLSSRLIIKTIPNAAAPYEKLNIIEIIVAVRSLMSWQHPLLIKSSNVIAARELIPDERVLEIRKKSHYNHKQRFLSTKKIEFDISRIRYIQTSQNYPISYKHWNNLNDPEKTPATNSPGAPFHSLKDSITYSGTIWSVFSIIFWSIGSHSW